MKAFYSFFTAFTRWRAVGNGHFVRALLFNVYGSVLVARTQALATVPLPFARSLPSGRVAALCRSQRKLV